MVLFRGIADDLALMDWLQKYIFPAEARNVTREFVEWGTLLACVEMIRSGTTTFADMYYFEDQVAEATARAGLRGILGETIIQFPVPDNKTPVEALAYTEEFIRRWKGHPLDHAGRRPARPVHEFGGISQGVQERSPTGTASPSPSTFPRRRTRSMKFAESTTRPRPSGSRRSASLAPNVIFNHGVWLTEGDMAIVRRHGVSITHNPGKQHEAGIRRRRRSRGCWRSASMSGSVPTGPPATTISTCSKRWISPPSCRSSSDNDPTALPARKVVEMATIGGARALKMDKETGSLEPGKRADFILVDTLGAHATPMYNVYSHLAYALKAADVRTTVVDGKILMLQGRVLTLDETRIREKARELQARIQSTLTK